MSDSIAELRRQLQEAQLGTTKKRLSERNCVELVTKLVNVGLLHVLYTQDGREYLTFEQLERETLQELSAHGGRLNLMDLVSLLGVDITYIETAVQQLLKTNKHLLLEQGELYLGDYFVNIAKEIDEMVQTTNYTTIAAIASKLDLPVSVVKELVLKHLGSTIDAKVENNIIYNTNYIRQQEAKVIGTLRGANVPVSLVLIAQRYDMRLDWVIEVSEKYDKTSGYVSGTGKNAYFIPQLFERNRLTHLKDHYLHNRFVGYEYLRHCYVYQPQTYCRQHFPDGYALSSGYLHHDLLSFIESATMEALENGQWLDWSPLLPFQLQDEDGKKLFGYMTKLSTYCYTVVADIQKILQTMDKNVIVSSENDLMTRFKASSCDKGYKGFIICWRWIFSMQLIVMLYRRFYLWGISEARSQLKNSSQLEQSLNTKNVSSNIATTSKKKKVKEIENVHSVSLSETKKHEMWDKSLEFLRQDSELEQVLACDAMGNNCEEDLILVLVENIFYRLFDDIYAEAAYEAEQIAKLEIKQKDESYRTDIRKLLYRLMFYADNLEAFATHILTWHDKDLIDQLDSHLCRTLGQVFVEQVVRYLNFTLGLASDTHVVSSKEVKQMIDQLPPYISEHVKNLQLLCRHEKKSQGPSTFQCRGFFEAYNAMASKTELPNVSPIMAKEREELRKIEWKVLETSLEEAKEPPDVLSKSLSFILAKHRDYFILFPGKCIPKLMKILSGTIIASRVELCESLENLQDIAVKILRSQTMQRVSKTEVSGNDKDDAEHITKVVDRVKGLIRNETDPSKMEET
eukprot:jgi/Galph1/3742/GphlegSOOS_G2388.1